MERILHLNNISKSFGGIQALTKVSVELRCGEVHCLVGENGAGKSTLGKIIAGIYRPDEGTITMEETQHSYLTPAKAKELKIAMVTQELNLMPHFSIAENIFMFEKDSYHGNAFLNRKKINQKTQALFDHFKLSHLPPVTTKVGELTIAQQQLVEIMKAMSQKNNVLLFDEPTTALSLNEVEQLFVLMNDLKSQGVSIVLVTHRMKEIFTIGDVVSVLCDGKMVKARIPIEELDEFKLVKLMVGRDIKDFYGTKEDLVIGAPVLKVNGISDGRLLKDISFTVHEKEIVGFAGLVGAGRSEIMETIFGNRKRVSGTIELNGRAIENRTIKQCIENGICLIPEDRKQQGLAVNLSIGANMNQVNMNRKRGFITYEGQFKLSNREMIEKLSIKLRDMSQRANNLSGGNQQKILLAKWLSQDPAVFIFDEPTRGIDVGTKVEIYDLIKQLAKKGKAIIVVSSEMQELISLCDRIIVVNEGRIVIELSSKETTEQDILQYAIAGK